MSDHSNLHLLIGGEKVSGGGRDMIEVIDPATAEVLGSLPTATTDDLDTALANADKGFHVWRKESADKRAAVLTKAGQLLRERAKDIGTLLTKEQGKPCPGRPRCIGTWPASALGSAAALRLQVAKALFASTL